MRRLRTVVLAQAAVILIGTTLSTVWLAASSPGAALFPRMLSVPLHTQEDTPASPELLVEAMRREIPGARVDLDDAGALLVVFEQGGFDLEHARAALRRHGYRADRFTIGRDFGGARIAGRLIHRLSGVAGLLVVMPIAFLAAGLFLRRRLPKDTARVSTPRAIAAGIAGGATLAAAAWVLGRILGAIGRPITEQPIFEQMARSNDTAPLLILVAAALLLAPLGEELFYRGWVFPYLEHVSAGLAYVVSAVFFAVIHFHPAAAPAYLLLGAGFGALYRWSRSIWSPVAAHATNNLIAICALFVSR